MLVITGFKIFVFACVMLPIGMGALGTGILFCGYNIGVSRNPEETENIFNATLMGFALIETFIFLSIILAFIVWII